MSLQNNWNSEIPFDVAWVGCQILAPDDPYRLVGDGINGFLSLKDFVDLYSELGRGAICPILLSLVTVFQYLENMPDRVAAHCVVVRMDWKYALHLPLLWPGFHYSDLSNFRKRLLEHQAERLIFDKVLEWVRSLGFLKKYGKQRSDSTHLLGCVERLTRLELVWETLRLGLRAVEKEAPQWYAQVIPGAFHEAYNTRQSDWRLSKQEVQEQMQKTGGDGFWLLDRLEKSAPQQVWDLPEIETLRTVWQQQFRREEDSGETYVRPPSGRGKGRNLVVSPHDPDARWSEKRGKDWVGYRLQVTETAEDGVTQQFITDVNVVAANQDDSEVVDDIQERLIEQDLKPQEHDVDQGYTSGANLAHSADRGIELLGPVAGDTAGKPEGFRQCDFVLDFDTQQAICPQGKTSLAWYERPQKDGYVGAEIQFKTQCDGCIDRARCAPGKCGRTLKVSPYYQIMRERRAEQETAAFKEKLKRRSAIEGTISELVRAHGARRARYRGQDKVRLQALFTAAAANLKRLARAKAAKKRSLAEVITVRVEDHAAIVHHLPA